VARDADGKAAILFGLGAVKSVGENAVNAVIRERESGGPYRDIFDFCSRIDTADCSKRVTESLIKAGAFDGMGANRPQMLAVYETAMDANQSIRKKNVSGQVSLFDMFGQDESPAMMGAQIRLPDLPDCPARVKLQMEKEASGVYMTGHPLDDYADVLKDMTMTAARVEDGEEDGQDLDGMFVDMGGILTEVKGKATKKGDYMAFLTLEDMTGQIECLAFPRVFERYQPLIREDEAVVISGKISVREEEAPKLLAERIARLDDWKKAPVKREPEQPLIPDAKAAELAEAKLFLRLERKDMDRTQAMLALDSGDIPVYMHIPAEKMTLLCPRSSWFSGSEDGLARLKEALGAENVVLRKKT
jgi:DNA polymerase-3 subunit alpha